MAMYQLLLENFGWREGRSGIGKKVRRYPNSHPYYNEEFTYHSWDYAHARGSQRMACDAKGTWLGEVNLLLSVVWGIRTWANNGNNKVAVPKRNNNPAAAAKLWVQSHGNVTNTIIWRCATLFASKCVLGKESWRAFLETQLLRRALQASLVLCA